MSIQELMNDYVTAMKTGDADWIVDHRAPEIVLFNLAPPLRQPKPHDADELRGWFGTFDGAVDYEIRDLQVTEDQTIAFAHGMVRLSAVPLGTDEKFDLWFRGTYAFKKTEKGWLIIHEHTSTPFYMDGEFGAALDLQP